MAIHLPSITDSSVGEPSDSVHSWPQAEPGTGTLANPKLGGKGNLVLDWC